MAFGSPAPERKAAMTRSICVLTVLSNLLVLGLSSRATVGVLPAGSYAGTARWTGPAGAAGSYTVERSFNGNVMTSHYRWTGTKRKEETLQTTFVIRTSDPFFDVLDDKNQVVGKGYCFEDTCSYSVN